MAILHRKQIYWVLSERVPNRFMKNVDSYQSAQSTQASMGQNVFHCLIFMAKGHEEYVLTHSHIMTPFDAPGKEVF